MQNLNDEKLEKEGERENRRILILWSRGPYQDYSVTCIPKQGFRIELQGWKTLSKQHGTRCGAHHEASGIEHDTYHTYVNRKEESETHVKQRSEARCVECRR
jgi:hypothetical protein